MVLFRNVVRVVCATALFCCFATVHADEPISARERFLREAPKAWREVKALNRDIDVKVISTSESRIDDSRWTGKDETIVKSRGEMLLQQLTDWPAEGQLPPSKKDQSKLPESRVDGTNDKQSFMLKKTGDTPWSVSYFGKIQDQRVGWILHKIGRHFTLYPWQIAEWYVPTLLDVPGFELREVENVKEDGASLVKVSFAIDPKKAGKDPYPRHGWILLDPLQRWSVRRCEAHLESPGGDVANMKLAIEYHTQGDTIPSRSTFAIEHEGKARYARSTLEFVKFERKQIDSAEFTLTAFGLEIPTGAKIDQGGFVRDYYGKEAPPLHIVDARGVPKNVKMADFLGKWVLIEFWGVNCQPCLQRSLPSLAKFYQEHAEERSRFEILAVCIETDPSDPKTIAELDHQIAPVVEKAWGGKPLPFPILIDDGMKTFESYRLHAMPAMVLVDPQGHVVKDASEGLLAEMLKQKVSGSAAPVGLLAPGVVK